MPEDHRHEQGTREEPEEMEVHKAGRTDQPEDEGGDTGAMPEENPTQQAGRTDQPEDEGGDTGSMAEGYGEDVGADQPAEETGRRTDEAGTPTGDRERDPDRPLGGQPGREETED